MAQLMPLSLTVSCFSKILIGLTFLVPAHPVVPEKGPLNVCVCVCVRVKMMCLRVCAPYTSQTFGVFDCQVCSQWSKIC